MGDVRVLPLEPQPVTPEAWAPFGSLPSDEGSEHDRADLEFLWDDGHVNFIGHRADEVRATGRGLVCDLLNRHDTHTQTLMPMDVPSVVVVAPAAVDFSAPGHLDTVRAFLLQPLECIHLARGTWHWGPFPVGAESVRVFNVQGRGYVRDNGVAFLERDHGVAFEVALPS